MLYVFLAISNGALTVGSRMVNAALGAAMGSLQGSFVNHLVGSLGAALLLVVGVRTGALVLEGVPWIYLTGGCLGVLIVAVSNYAVRTIGAALFAVLLLTGQLVSSAGIDHFGWLSAQRIIMTPAKLFGLALILIGAALVVTDSGVSSRGSDRSGRRSGRSRSGGSGRGAGSPGTSHPRRP